MRQRGFTLVEILIVVVILGVLSAIVVPRFSDATDEASAGATRAQLDKVRNAMAVYFLREDSRFPQVAAGSGTWGEILSADYLRRVPINKWVDPSDTGPGREIVFGVGPDAGYQTTHGWIFNPATGEVWAGGFDGGDQPYPKP